MPGPVSPFRTVVLAALGAACGGLVGWWTQQFVGHIAIWIGIVFGSLSGALIERTMHARAVRRFEASHRDPADPRR